MALQRADPTPFVPPGMQWEDVPNRVRMIRVVAQSRPQARNENLAIVTINPLPGNPLDFTVVREGLREFLVDQERVNIRDIQPTHLG